MMGKRRRSQSESESDLESDASNEVIGLKRTKLSLANNSSDSESNTASTQVSSEDEVNERLEREKEWADMEVNTRNDHSRNDSTTSRSRSESESDSDSDSDSDSGDESSSKDDSSLTADDGSGGDSNEIIGGIDEYGVQINKNIALRNKATELASSSSSDEGFESALESLGNISMPKIHEHYLSQSQASESEPDQQNVYKNGSANSDNYTVKSESENEDSERPTISRATSIAEDCGADSDSASITDFNGSDDDAESNKSNDYHGRRLYPKMTKEIQRKVIPLMAGLKPNIYNSANLEIVSGKKLKFKKPRLHKGDIVKVDNAVVPKLKKEFAELGIYKQPTGINQSSYKSIDEILTDSYNFNPNELVYLDRSEIARLTGVDLPGEDIANALHYYVADYIKRSQGITDAEYDANFSKFLDGSALLGLSALLTKWVEDAAGNTTYKSHMEKVRATEPTKMGHLAPFVSLRDDDDDDDENSDGANQDQYDDGRFSDEKPIAKSEESEVSADSGDSESISSESSDSE